MANFCPYCGSGLKAGATHCSSCGAGVSATNNSTNTQSTTVNINNNASSAVADTVGTLVAVTLAGGLTRQLYYHCGRYYHDPMCHRPFVGSIIGPPRHIHIHVGPHRPMGRPHPMPGGPHRPIGGPHPMGGGPRGGGPRGPR